MTPKDECRMRRNKTYLSLHKRAFIFFQFADEMKAPLTFEKQIFLFFFRCIKKAFAICNNGNTIQLLSWYKHRTKCMLSRARNINRGIENIWLWIWFSNYFMCNLLWNAFMSKSLKRKNFHWGLEQNLFFLLLLRHKHSLSLVFAKLCTDCIWQNVKLL